jgi:hypothetical protein
MNQALQKVSNLQLSTLDDLRSLGEVFARSGYFKDAADMSKAIVKIIAGGELGFGPMASMTGIYIVKEKVTLSANLIGAAIKRSGRYNYRILQHTDQICEIEFFENGQPIGKSSFTIEDARKAELTSNATWKKFPRNMLFARAISNGAKWHCCDIFGGPIYTPDELGAPVAITEDGEIEVIEETTAPTPAKVISINPDAPPPVIDAVVEDPKPEQPVDLREKARRLVQIKAIKEIDKESGKVWDVTDGTGPHTVIHSEGFREDQMECDCDAFIDSTDSAFFCEHILAVWEFTKQAKGSSEFTEWVCGADFRNSILDLETRCKDEGIRFTRPSNLVTMTKEAAIGYRNALLKKLDA